ncbi:hypothetical protein [uncultured Desulfuromusa sp.]|uniref:hypothetical protein n=1 Tax=uncultured Desulfuromusa sp. TaxID=219183 RepID=UPI002AA819AD|nr:hypothetical protein [uncultured Desulfuromusa sp.]
MIVIDLRGCAVGIILTIWLATIISAVVAHNIGAVNELDPLHQALVAARYGLRVESPEYWMAGWTFLTFLPATAMAFGRIKTPEVVEQLEDL